MDNNPNIKGWVSFRNEMFVLSKIISGQSKDPEVIQFTKELLQGSFTPGYKTAEKLFMWVRDNIRFVEDPPGLELVAYPFTEDGTGTLQTRIGDCDDMVILLGSMLKAVGFKIGLVTINYKSAVMNHIYLIVFTPEGAFYLDPTAKDEPLGYQAPPGSYTAKEFFLIR